jgi:hypothetical protein
MFCSYVEVWVGKERPSEHTVVDWPTTAYVHKVECRLQPQKTSRNCRSNGSPKCSPQHAVSVLSASQLYQFDHRRRFPRFYYPLSSFRRPRDPLQRPHHASPKSAPRLSQCLLMSHSRSSHLRCAEEELDPSQCRPSRSRGRWESSQWRSPPTSRSTKTPSSLARL